MASFPEFLYQLTARDRQVTGLEIVSQNLNGAAIAATVATNRYTIPLGKTLVLGAWNLRCFQAVAAATPAHIRAYCDHPSAMPGVAFSSIPSADLGGRSDGTDVHCSISGNGTMYFPEGYEIYAQGTWAAGVVTNSINLDFWGVLIPRGNFAV